MRNFFIANDSYDEPSNNELGIIPWISEQEKIIYWFIFGLLSWFLLYIIVKLLG